MASIVLGCRSFVEDSMAHNVGCSHFDGRSTCRRRMATGLGAA